MRLLLILSLLLISLDALSHSGRTNSAGCHNDRKNGGYHCHNSPKIKQPSKPNNHQKVTTNRPTKHVNNHELIRAIISQSIKNYSGKCPCPYSLMSNGSSCGKRSAYSKPGGASPICYASDVTEEMILEYKKKRID